MVPSLDALGAIADLAGGAVSAYENGFKYGAESLVIGGVYLASALYGARNVRACRRQTDAAVALRVAHAASSARAGGCSDVVDIAVGLARDAPDAYVTFIHDPAFASCF